MPSPEDINQNNADKPYTPEDYRRETKEKIEQLVKELGISDTDLDKLFLDAQLKYLERHGGVSSALFKDVKKKGFIDTKANPEISDTMRSFYDLDGRISTQLAVLEQEKARRLGKDKPKSEIQDDEDKGWRMDWR